MNILGRVIFFYINFMKRNLLKFAPKAGIFPVVQDLQIF